MAELRVNRPPEPIRAASIVFVSGGFLHDQVPVLDHPQPQQLDGGEVGVDMGECGVCDTVMYDHETLWNIPHDLSANCLCSACNDKRLDLRDVEREREME